MPTFSSITTSRRIPSGLPFPPASSPTPQCIFQYTFLTGGCSSLNRHSPQSADALRAVSRLQRRSGPGIALSLVSGLPFPREYTHPRAVGKLDKSRSAGQYRSTAQERGVTLTVDDWKPYRVLTACGSLVTNSFGAMRTTGPIHISKVYRKIKTMYRISHAISSVFSPHLQGGNEGQSRPATQKPRTGQGISREDGTIACR